MRVLVGCEESGKVRDAFIRRGHQAYSNDLIPPRNNGPHLQMDVIDAISFGGWDLIILHPDCTKIAVSGNRWYGKNTPGYPQRIEALQWTKYLWEHAKRYAPRVCLENPVGVLKLEVDPQYIGPEQFGHPETKKTGLWLHNLPPLAPTNPVTPTEQRIWKMPPSPTRKRDRSETYQGIANAMAEQWG